MLQFLKRQSYISNFYHNQISQYVKSTIRTRKNKKSKIAKSFWQLDNERMKK